MSEMVFNNGSVPVAVAAKVYKKDPCWVRAGLIAGWLPIGFATRDGKLIKDIQRINSKFGRINYYISPKKLHEETGYIYEREVTKDGDNDTTGNFSQNNEYWISKHRYYELKHFCMQYPLWKAAYRLLELEGAWSLICPDIFQPPKHQIRQQKQQLQKSYFGRSY